LFSTKPVDKARKIVDNYSEVWKTRSGKLQGSVTPPPDMGGTNFLIQYLQNGFLPEIWLWKGDKTTSFIHTTMWMGKRAAARIAGGAGAATPPYSRAQSARLVFIHLSTPSITTTIFN
jgi:hypothetical protein